MYIFKRAFINGYMAVAEKLVELGFDLARSYFKYRKYFTALGYVVED
jgi:hypothetical protein